MTPKIFGWEHIVILCISIALMIASIIIICKYVKNDKTKNLIVKIVAGVLLVTVIVNRISVCLKYEPNEWARLIPNSFCGMSSFVVALAVLLGKKDNDVLHFVWFVALLGGTLTMFYPDFIGQSTSVFYIPTISGILHHTIAVYLVLLLLLFKYIVPTYKKWYTTIIGFAFYITIGTFELSVFGLEDAFYIVKPVLSGTPLTVWIIAPIYVAIYAGVLALIEFIRIKNAKKNTNANEPAKSKKSKEK